MSSIYKEGTVDVTNGSYIVDGFNTRFKTIAGVQPGDLFTINGTKLYEIYLVESDTRLRIRGLIQGELYNEGDLVGANYAIVRNFSSDTDATVAANVIALQQKWHRRENEMYGWFNAETEFATVTSIDGEQMNVITPFGINALVGGPVNTDEFAFTINGSSELTDLNAFLNGVYYTIEGVLTNQPSDFGAGKKLVFTQGDVNGFYQKIMDLSSGKQMYRVGTDIQSATDWLQVNNASSIAAIEQRVFNNEQALPTKLEVSVFDALQSNLTTNDTINRANKANAFLNGYAGTLQEYVDNNTSNDAVSQAYYDANTITLANFESNLNSVSSIIGLLQTQGLLDSNNTINKANEAYSFAIKPTARLEIESFAGANFGEKLQAAIDAAPENSIIDCVAAVKDTPSGYVMNNSITFTKAALVYLPPDNIIFANPQDRNVHQFVIGADNVQLIGFGRSSRRELKLTTTTLKMTNPNGGYNVYSRGQNVIRVSQMDIEGLRTDSFAAVEDDPINPINGTGGIYLEKPNPGVVVGGNNVNQVQLDSLYIENTRAHGIYIDTPILAMLTNIRISGAGGHGFFLNGGTSSRLDNCYTSSAHKAGFCLASHSYAALSACAAEYSGIGYWLRSCNAIALIACGAESNGNRQQTVPNMDIQTTTGAGDPITISDVGGDNETNFWRGHGYAVTGGRNISLLNVYATNCGLASPTQGQSSQTRGILVKGTARNIEIRYPRIKMSAGEIYSGRFDIGIEAFGGEQPRNTELVFDPAEDAILGPNADGEYVTTINSSAYSCPILNEGQGTCIKYGDTFLTPVKGLYDAEVVTDPGNGYTIDSESASVVDMTLVQSSTNIALANRVDDKSHKITLILRQSTGSNLVNWSGVTWSSGSAPVLSSDSSGLDFFEFTVTKDIVIGNRLT